MLLNQRARREADLVNQGESGQNLTETTERILENLRERARQYEEAGLTPDQVRQQVANDAEKARK